MKICTSCNLCKDETEFVFKNRRKNKRHSWCKACHKIYKDEHYRNHKKLYITKAAVYNRHRKEQIVDYLREYVSKFPCVDCGERDYIVLHFDHVRGIKVASISHMISNGWSWDKVVKELEKCQVRCANCHARRTAKQFGWLKFKTVCGRAEQAPVS